MRNTHRNMIWESFVSTLRQYSTIYVDAEGVKSSKRKIQPTKKKLLMEQPTCLIICFLRKYFAPFSGCLFCICINRTF